MAVFDVEVLHILYVGLSVMVLSSGRDTLKSFEKLLLKTIQEVNPSFTADGYVIQGIGNFSMSIFMWIIPSVIRACGPKYSCIMAAFAVSLHTASLLTQSTWLVYLTAAVDGFGIGLVYTAESIILLITSSRETLARNWSIIAALTVVSSLLGNIVVLPVLSGKDIIDLDTAFGLVIRFLFLSLLAILFFVFLPSYQQPDESGREPVSAVKRIWRTATSKRMATMFFATVFFGLILQFNSGVFGACVGFTEQIADRDELVPLCSMAFGIGAAIVQCPLIFLFRRITSWRWGTACVVFSGMVVYYLSNILIFLSLPDQSVFGNTDDTALITSRWWVLLMASVLQGMIYGIFYSTNSSTLGLLFRSNNADAFAIMTFFDCISRGMLSFASNYLGLYYQLLLLTVVGTLGAISVVFATFNKHVSGFEKNIETEESVPVLQSQE